MTSTTTMTNVSILHEPACTTTVINNTGKIIIGGTSTTTNLGTPISGTTSPVNAVSMVYKKEKMKEIPADKWERWKRRRYR